jgi:hypothetical protein
MPNTAVPPNRTLRRGGRVWGYSGPTLHQRMSVSDAHQVIIHHHSQVIGRIAIRLHEDLVVNIFGVNT